MNRFKATLMIIALLIPAGNLLAQSRAEKANDFTLELGGRCIAYCLSYQRVIGEHFGLEVGASVIGGTDASVIFLSGGARVYLTKSAAAPCLSGGIVYITAQTDAGPFDAADSGVYFYGSPGFEYRSSGGFVFRAGITFLIKDGFFVWPSLTLGVAF